MAEQQIKILGARVLVTLIQEEAKTTSGILIAEGASKDLIAKAKVLGWGDDVAHAKQFTVGDIVHFPKYSFTPISLLNNEHEGIVEAADIIAVVKN